MSQADTHPADFDYHPFDPRELGMHPQGHNQLPYATRDMAREFWPGREQQQQGREQQQQREGPLGREAHPRETVTTSFYHTPSASMPSASLSSMLGQDVRPANGLSSQQNAFAPRMFPGQGLQQNVVDGWNAPPPLNGTPSGPGMAPPPPSGLHSQSGVTINGRPPSLSSVTQGQPQPVQNKLALNHHHRASPPRPQPSFAPTSAPAAFNHSDRDSFRDAFLARQFHQTASPPSVSSVQAQPGSLPSPNSANPPRSTLWWGELEPWMDEEYAKQVCNLMGWDPVSIKVPRPAPDPITGRQANNPGYCFLTFPSQGHAASVLAQVNSTNNGNPITMPNSSKPFTMNWASSVPTAPLSMPFSAPTISIPGAQNPQYPKEYSIFVGDLAPEVSNSDLVAVFRNPVLGLRNDREPRFIRPFLSCKSAKIMLDPVTGVSRGYGFVRFTDEADQQRALIEMHGLYCLSRPMRISPATAKFKPMPGMPGMDMSQMPFQPGMPSMPQMQDMQKLAQTMPLPNGTKSVSTPLASATNGGNPAMGGMPGSTPMSAPSFTSTSSMASSATLASTPSEDVLKAAQMSGNSQHPSPPSANPNVPSSISAGLAQPTHDQLMAQRYNIPEESWKHHAQARAILSNLIGPNGEQLTSSDPYNTTVFVGGLSPLISEETLRTFFAPFGEIHYVKVPVGKHCGFVQFVRKPDAERAIEKMQGFPIGGSRIRLSWGRSQYKAAQAAAQAAQAAAFQSQYHQVQMAPSNAPTLTAEQAMQLLEKFGITQFLNNSNNQASAPVNADVLQQVPTAEQMMDAISQYEAFGPSSFEQRSGFSASAFSPFSPDPNYLLEKNRENSVSVSPGQAQSFSSTSSKGYAPWYTSTPQDEKAPGAGNGSGKVSPTGSAPHMSRPNSARPFGSFLGETQPNRTSSRQEGPIARPELARRPSQGMSSQEHYHATHEREHDAIQDLNGTLASLNLDHQWKGNEGAHPTAA